MPELDGMFVLSGVVRRQSDAAISHSVQSPTSGAAGTRVSQGELRVETTTL